MRFLVKKKITLSFLILVFFVFCFLVFNKALFKDKIYSPEFKDGKTTYLVDFSLPELYSVNEIKLSEVIENKNFSIINIWASWCVPCRDEHYFLMSLREQKKLEIIGLNYKDKIGNAKNFLKELGNPYKHILLDEKGIIAIEWGAYGVPESFLIYDKKIIKKIIGPINKDIFLEMKELIK